MQSQETRCLAKAVRSGVAAPAVYFVDPSEGTIIMEHIAGATVKQVIQRSLLPREAVAERIGKLVASAHDCDLIHGDLTTSNIIFREGDSSEAVLIDFGLAQVSTMIEDRAVDLYVLERALLSTHPGSTELFAGILNAYAAHLPSEAAKAVLDKLAEGNCKRTCAKSKLYPFSLICVYLVQLRGRKRSMVG
jgi:TP53 regulating kinase-like protein